ncbi:MAG: hypothetical protein WDM79_11865 [Terricaulis sp.]
MESELAGSAWLIVVAGGAAALGVALIVAGVMWLTRDKSKDERAERGAKKIYADADAEEARDHERVN